MSCLAAFLVAGGITRLAPLDWIGPAISLVVLRLLASLALLRALLRHSRLAPGAAGAVDVRVVHPAGGAGIRVVGGGAEFAADAGRAGMGVRGRGVVGAHRQPAVRGYRCLLVYVGGLLFFEKAAVIPFVAFAIVALYAHVTGSGSVAQVWRRGMRLWVAAWR